ncbi:hypothetical protein OHB41_50085 [Streptomyces sp. NBC_01571]|uniref:hypothetical protein n=1 Tax=Streptomyces sp. NBC_01571 TaxID=2975883 RepID=UPI00224E0317|nr:hypothetical protein [Streptomyces sp. NBC_01571]MCX4581115.1 hypothetical protein [Streptomyces sp. NBC_01571]
MSEHSVYAVFGVTIEPPETYRVLDSALAAQRPAAELPESEQARLDLFMVGDSAHVILGTSSKTLEPCELLSASNLVAHPADRKALRHMVEELRLTVLTGPDWLLVHDLD